MTFEEGRKVHALRPLDPSRTLCGRWAGESGWDDELATGETWEVTCRACLRALALQERKLQRKADR